jgi:putative ABC transport system permease protein
MAVPVIYNLRSIRVRWGSTAVAVAGIAGVVAVFVAMLSMAQGFRKTLVASGSERNAIVRRGGASSEMESVIYLSHVKIIQDAPGIARRADGRPLVSPEAVVVAAFHHRASDSDALAQVRGLSPIALEVHDGVRLVQGRFFEPGQPELVVGRNAHAMYTGLELGDEVKLGGRAWRVVGLMDAGGTAFDSELWADSDLLLQTYQRPTWVFSSCTARLNGPDALGDFRRALEGDPRLTIQVDRETDYYAKQSRAVATMITVLGYLVAFVMGVGAVFGAVNTMYSAVDARTREIATLRALGFSGWDVMVSMGVESLVIAALGGVAGCIGVQPLHGHTTSTINWQTMSQLAFAFQITPGLMVQGMAFALLMGAVGGFLPALRASRIPVAAALREL